MDADRRYTTQLGAGLGMVAESQQLLQVWEPGDTPVRLTEKAVQAGLFSRATARRTRNLVVEMFAPRFLVDGDKPARRLRTLAQSGVSKEALSQFFFLKQLERMPFLRILSWSCTGRNTAPAFSPSRRPTQRGLFDGRSTMERPRRSGVMKWWTGSRVILSAVAGISACCPGVESTRSIQRFSIRKEVALYLAHDLHFAGYSDMTVATHRDWSLFGLENTDVVKVLKNLASDGHFFIQCTADLVQISWVYKTEKELLNALAKG